MTGVMVCPSASGRDKQQPMQETSRQLATCCAGRFRQRCTWGAVSVAVTGAAASELASAGAISGASTKPHASSSAALQQQRELIRIHRIQTPWSLTGLSTGSHACCCHNTLMPPPYQFMRRCMTTTAIGFVTQNRKFGPISSRSCQEQCTRQHPVAGSCGGG